MEAMAAGLQSLHAARAAGGAGMHGERRHRIEALFHDACRALDPLYTALHAECADLLQGMLDKAGSKSKAQARSKRSN